MNYLATFFAGAFLCNAAPHLVSGVLGAPFPTPFAKPRGVGLSAPLLNFLWGTFNGLVGVCLLSQRIPAAGLNADFAVLVAGFLAMGSFLAWHFGRVRRDAPGRRNRSQGHSG
jgi:hypothetical protein